MVESEERVQTAAQTRQFGARPRCRSSGASRGRTGGASLRAILSICGSQCTVGGPYVQFAARGLQSYKSFSSSPAVFTGAWQAKFWQTYAVALASFKGRSARSSTAPMASVFSGAAQARTLLGR